MKKFLANILARIILNADSRYKKNLYKVLLSASVQDKRKFFREKYDISETFKFNGHFINFYGEGQIICRDKSYIGDYSTIQAFEGCTVTIGTNCAISHNVRIYTSSYKADQDFDSNTIKEIAVGNVQIGNGVWIGANVFINPGITIGNNAVIGANSVVTKDIAPNTINGGVPAKIIREKIL